ncbi:MAG: hypothetical protein ACRD3W_20490, partial [Terriglobales bacterium]
MIGRWRGRAKGQPPRPDDQSLPFGGRRVDLLILAILLALFCVRVWDLGVVTRDDALWTLYAWQNKWDVIWTWATQQGRVWALVSGPLLFLALKIKGVVVGNLAIVGSFAVFFALFYRIVAVHFGRRLAVLAACLNLGLYAMRWEGSLITAYPLFTWVLGSLYLGALLTLERYLGTGKRSILAVSVIFLFCSLFLHEGVTALFVLLYPLAALHHGRDRPRGGDLADRPIWCKASGDALLGWLIVVALYTIVYVGWRFAFPTNYAGNMLADFDVLRIARVVLAFALSGSIFHDMFATYTVRFSDAVLLNAASIGYPFWQFVRHPRMYAGSFVAGSLSALLIWHALAQLRSPVYTKNARVQHAFAVIVGALIAFVPILPVAATTKYQQWYYEFGIRAYVHTALSHFGVSLVIAVALIWMTDSLRRRFAWLTMAVATSCIFAVLCGAGYAMNDAIAQD